jgi:hypothetical protein
MEIDIINLLLIHGADPSVINSKERRPVDVAIKNGHLKAARVLDVAMKEKMR